MIAEETINTRIRESPLISRDLSWIKFNYRVLDQVTKEDKTVFEKLKFLAITQSNLDEFFMIRVGSLINYIDYGKQRMDYSGLREIEFKRTLLTNVKTFCDDQHARFIEDLSHEFSANNFIIQKDLDVLDPKSQAKIKTYFKKTVFPMLTPMTFDTHHTFPILMNLVLAFAVETKIPGSKDKHRKLTFVQIPQNLPRFYEIKIDQKLVFIPLEEIIRHYIDRLFRNMDIMSVNLMRITRNGDFTLEESDDIDANFVDEIKSKLKTRKTGRVVRLEVEEGFNKSIIKNLKSKYSIDDLSVFKVPKTALIGYTGLWQIVGNEFFRDKIPSLKAPVLPLSYPIDDDYTIFDVLSKKDVLLHHPYNSMEPVLDLLEKSAEDPGVLSIKLTIYRLARDSRITAALLKAAENGKHVAVLFELKARFDEENNIKEAQKLQKAGCFVIYGISSYKTHTKLLLIVRKEKRGITRYLHMSTGNYNESTAKLYTDLSLMTTNEVYANDVSEFFNVITGHSQPSDYEYLITSPHQMRPKLIELIRNEAQNARDNKPSGIVIKINSLQDKEVIEELYLASQAGVKIRLIIRGICCIRPGQQGLSENITVRSLVGNYLEHSRIFYFHNENDPLLYAGSADIMVRSFDRRLESLFRIVDVDLKNQLICNLVYNLKDNVNAYEMQEDGSYIPTVPSNGTKFNIHEEFFRLTRQKINDSQLFEQS